MVEGEREGEGDREGEGEREGEEEVEGGAEANAAAKYTMINAMALSETIPERKVLLEEKAKEAFDEMIKMMM